MPPDLTDVRVLIPRTRRALEGPFGSASGAPGSTLSDEQVEAMIADAIADVILYTGGLFGHNLEVVSRDDNYGAPTAWKTSEELTEPEGTVIVSQAAINYFFQSVKDLKVQETISNEGTTWSYGLSANAITEWLRLMREARDKALELVGQQNGIIFDAYTSFIQVRDSQVAAFIEPWVSGSSGGGLDADPRFLNA